MSARPDKAPGYLPPNAATHKPFSFLADRLRNDRSAEFAASVFDITQGITACLEIIHRSELTRTMNRDDPDDQQMPLVDVNDTERLLRFSMAAASMMATQAERQIDWMNEYFNKRDAK